MGTKASKKNGIDFEKQERISSRARSVAKGDLIEFRGGEKDLKELIIKSTKPLVIHVIGNEEDAPTTMKLEQLVYNNSGLFHLVEIPEDIASNNL